MNRRLADKGFVQAVATSTSTAIVGCLFKDEVVLGADTRVTERQAASCRHPRSLRSHALLIQSHYLTESIRCCGARTAADTEFTTSLISSDMDLVHALWTGRKPRVVTAMTMLKQMLFQYVITSLSPGLFGLDVSPVLGIKVRSVRRSCLGALTQRVPIYSQPTRLDGQAALCHHGFGQSCGHGGL